MTVQEWRGRHRRCAWCVHIKSDEVYDDDYTDLYITIYTCTAKNRRVDPTTPRPFCRLFKQRNGGLP